MNAAGICRVCGEPVRYRDGLSNRVHGRCRALEAAKKRAKPERATPAYKLARAVSRHGVTVPNMDVEKGNHRSEALRRSAKGEACVRCGVRDGSVVWAHSNEGEHGKGKSLKAHDLLGNYLCFHCHNFYDTGTASREVKHAFFRECYPKTMTRVAEKLAAGTLRL